MSPPSPFGATIDDLDGLRSIYREPVPMVQTKVKPALDEVTRRFIARSPFVLVGTVSTDGRLDVSPRGGPAGFVRTMTAGDGSDLLVLPDLNGNNLLDTMRNVVQTGRVGMLFLVPGKDETLRVNGRAWVVTEGSVLDACASASLARPKAAVGVAVEEVFVHCAKAFRRAQLWDVDSWAALADAPDAIEMVCGLGIIEPDMAETQREHLASGYEAELALDRPGAV